MRILDRYILKSVLSVFFLCLFTFILLYVIIDTFSFLQDILKQKIPLFALVRYYLYYLPIIFVQVSPVACLLAVLYTVGTLNRNNEIIAMRSSGLSVLWILKAVILFGLILSIVIFWVNDRFLPQALSATQRMKAGFEGGQKTPAKKTDDIINFSMYGLKNRLYFINRFSPESKSMEGITILEHDEKQNMIKKIIAERGIYEDDLWKFYKSITYNFDINGQVLGEPLYFEEEFMNISETPADFLIQRNRPELMTMAEIENYIYKLSRSGATAAVRNFKVDLYQRFSQPFTSFLMILLAIPFSFVMRRRASGMSSLGLALMMGFLYYVLNAMAVALGKGGFLAPLLSGWLAFWLTLAASLYLIKKLP